MLTGNRPDIQIEIKKRDSESCPSFAWVGILPCGPAGNDEALSGKLERYEAGAHWASTPEPQNRRVQCGLGDEGWVQERGGQVVKGATGLRIAQTFVSLGKGGYGLGRLGCRLKRLIAGGRRRHGLHMDAGLGALVVAEIMEHVVD